MQSFSVIELFLMLISSVIIGYYQKQEFNIGIIFFKIILFIIIFKIFLRNMKIVNSGNKTVSSHVCVCMWIVAQSCLTLRPIWTGARQAPLSMGIPRQKHWSGLPFPVLGDLPNPGMEPTSLVSPALSDLYHCANWK